MRHQFIVAFGDTKHLVDGLNPGGRVWLLVYDASENGPERLTKAEDAQQGRINRLGFAQKQGAETRSTILGHQASICQKRNEFVPGEVVGHRREIGEIERDAPGNQMGRWGPAVHQITLKML